MKFTLIGALAAYAAMSGAAFAQTELSLWYLGAGNVEAAAVLNGAIEDFNASQSDWTVVVESFPQAAYNDSVVAAALAGNLPDIIAFFPSLRCMLDHHYWACQGGRRSFRSRI